MTPTKTWWGVRRNCEITMASDLMFHAFMVSTNKFALRTEILSAFSALDAASIPRTLRVTALRDRAERALAYKAPVSTT